MLLPDLDLQVGVTTVPHLGLGSAGWCHPAGAWCGFPACTSATYRADATGVPRAASL